MVPWKGDRSCWFGLEAVELMCAGDIVCGESSGEDMGPSMGDWTAVPATGATNSKGMFHVMACGWRLEVGEDMAEDMVVGGTGMADDGETAPADDVVGEVVKG